MVDRPDQTRPDQTRTEQTRNFSELSQDFESLALVSLDSFLSVVIVPLIYNKLVFKNTKNSLGLKHLTAHHCTVLRSTALHGTVLSCTVLQIMFYYRKLEMK